METFNRARVTKNAKIYIARYGIEALAGAKHYFEDRGVPPPVTLNVERVEEYLHALEQQHTKPKSELEEKATN